MMNFGDIMETFFLSVLVLKTKIAAAVTKYAEKLSYPLTFCIYTYTHHSTANKLTLSKQGCENTISTDDNEIFKHDMVNTMRWIFKMKARRHVFQDKLQHYCNSWEHILIGTEIVLYLFYIIHFPLYCPLCEWYTILTMSG